MKLAVALSGGVDSLAALLLLQAEGYRVIGLHAFFQHGLQKRQRKLQFLSRLCARLGVELQICDLSQAFDSRVIQPFVLDYLSGLTPNPCAICNREIKFDLLSRKAFEFGAGLLVTGHYACLNKRNKKRPILSRGVDSGKDQSYFLSLLSSEQLSKAMFPLGDMKKSQAQSMVKKAFSKEKLPNESHEICFIPENDYRLFLQKRRVDLPGPGLIQDLQGQKLGRHRGLHCYTIGQRRGLGIPDKEPLYVVGKDTQKNILLVGYKKDLLENWFQVKELNFIEPYEDWPKEVFVQTVYRQQAKKAKVHLKGELMQVFFAESRKQAVPGQICAFYTKEGQVLGGGRVNAE